jgi:hypothetical protein
MEIGPAWRSTNREGGRLSVSPTGRVYHTGVYGHVFGWNGSGWDEFEIGVGRDTPFAVAADGTIWWLERDFMLAGYNPSSGKHESAPFGADTQLSDITIDENGEFWVIGDWRLNDDNFGERRGIYRGRPGNWQLVPGRGWKIAARAGQVWHAGVGDDENIFVWDGRGNWALAHGFAIDIAVGNHGEVWHVGRNHMVYLIDRSGNLIQIPDRADAQRIEVGDNGLPFIVTVSGEIVQRI